MATPNATPSSSSINLTVRVATCAPAGRCFELRLPDAQVSLSTAGNPYLASKRTDDYGDVQFSLNTFGPVHVVIESSIIKGGKYETDMRTRQGRRSDLTLTAPMTPDATPDYLTSPPPR